MSSGFEDKTGIIKSATDWGSWYQTIEDITAEILVPLTTKGRDIKIKILPSSLSCSVNGKEVLSGKLFASIVCDESTWTLEDHEDNCRIIRIFLVKGNKTPQSCWTSLLQDKYPADMDTLDKMQKKILQERYQSENPGFDFSQAEVTGNYQNGGPTLS
ncbi:nudC domain-containing protein 2-like [Bolinopsis microptera]|uniref:nudC domain-containing protein 2-like n=1 Tax=Bolinopsis microptera TaxID=2820187 RepID=UPI00307A391B